LIELTMSVLVLGILAAVAMPIYSNSLLKYRSEVAAQRIVQDLAQAQRLARLSNANRTISFDATGNSYSIGGLASLDRPGALYNVPLSQPPYSVDITSLATAAQPTTQLATLTVTFDRFGMPNQGFSLIVRAGDQSKQVNVAPITGRVSVQ
jgi:type II secretory pathway pseudopilin PulG